MPLYTEIYRKNAADQNRAADFVRACAVETDINMSEEPLYTEIYREKAAGQNFARPSSVLASGKGESPFWRFHKSHSWDHPIRNQLLEEEVGMTHHESKKLVLKRENFPPKSCSSSSQSTFQSATSWMTIMHPTCCRNSPGLMLTLALALFIYHEILILDVTSQENQRQKNMQSAKKISLSSAFSTCLPSEGISMREPQRGNVLKWTKKYGKID